ncbi:vitamin K-dependent protein C-like [Latimeria chalumnae]|uniref:Vitamin K-dependent protein C n=1 Tax=Latimeria chalumnae TaxID=7897 RepID=M3XJJ3_LATCH|nr:PREDICTED: vitamin K-dependent protein C-like isoform X2 [Latimeria chalumnae]XP_014343633.1 PREDICTED: vitamin K-dependent protein C-like isoform X2 [Latimeria chalumnae]|eukprot:XP_014343632.1 PREDICTED: vitamin K-dependent protein C-like isoform X2 [Latimeria chalumnae]
MWMSSSLLPLLLILCVFSVVHTSVFYSKNEADSILRIHKRANTFLEEFKPGSLERECHEEQCSFEEALEIFQTKEATLDFWTKYYDGDQCDPMPCVNGTCMDQIGGFNCICNLGWEGNNCEYEIIDANCSINNGGCEHFCYHPDEEQNRYCSCVSGFQLDINHHSCEPTADFPCGVLQVGEPLFQFVNMKPYVMGGTTGTRGHSPWQVMLLGPKGLLICGAVLIHHFWVLTAAHCVENGGLFKVKLGEHDRGEAEGTEKYVWVDKIIMHANYSTNTAENDIAMLHLQNSVTYGQSILPICLPIKELAENVLVQEGSNVTVSGWGTQDKVTNARSRVLQFIEIPIASHSHCRQVMENAVSANMLCAGIMGDTKDACSGDSGGPMVKRYKRTWFLVGLVSWGEGCGEENKYGVYTKVSNYLTWIQEIMETKP